MGQLRSRFSCLALSNVTWPLIIVAAIVGSMAIASCGGGGNSGSSSTPVNNPVPTITSLSPSTGTTGAAAQTLSINGTNFISSSTASYNGATHSVTFVNSTQLTISLNAADQEAGGNYAVVVTNPAPGGGASNSVNFVVNNPVPTISSLSPSAATAGAGTQTLTINGANFLTSSTVTFNGVAHAPTYVSASQLTISATANDQANAGNYPVVVTNPSPGGGSTIASTFTVNNPSPVLTTITPAKLAVGSPATLITAAGNNFVSTSQIAFNGTAAATTFVSPLELTATVPASALASGTPVSVAIISPSPGGGNSSSLSIQLASVASLTMLATPATATDPTGPWQAIVSVKDAAGNPLAGLPFTLSSSQGSLSVDDGVTDMNGSLSATLTPPAGIASTDVVGLTATIGTQSVSTSIAFTPFAASGTVAAPVRIGSRTLASVIRTKRGIAPLAQSSTPPTLAPVAIGISTGAPGSTSPFAAPNYCYTISSLALVPSSQCAALFNQENISLLPSNPFQAGCQIADYASTAFGVAECAGAGVTLASCALSLTGAGSVATGGLSDAICAGYIDLTATTLLPDCEGFLLSQFVKYYSPSSQAALDFMQLSIDPIPNDPLDYAVAVCEASTPAANSSPGASVSPVAGNGNKASTVMNGSALGISLNAPSGIAIDSKGNVFFDDDGNNAVLELTPANEVITFAGTGTAGFSGDDGPATSAQLNNPTHLAVDANGNLFISDAGNNRIRMVNAQGIISTVAGNGYAGFSGDGPDATKVELNFPDSVAFDSNGNLYIADYGNNRIRMVTPSGAISTVAGNGTAGFNSDNVPATTAELNEPARAVVDSSGNLYIADLGNNRVREVNGSTHVITTIAGTGSPGTSPNGTSAINAEINQPISVALDSQGNVFVSSIGDNLVRAINTQASATTLLGVEIPPGAIATVIGGGNRSDIGVLPALDVSLSFPTGLITDSIGYLYVADADNNVIVRAK